MPVAARKVPAPFGMDGVSHTKYGYWLEEAGTVDAAPPLAGRRKADVVILGGGFTGMWCAWHLRRLEPDARVVLIESDLCGHGPSGRNGGFLNTMAFELNSLRMAWGDAGAVEVSHAADRAFADIVAFCGEQRIDAWLREADYLQVATAPAQDDAWLAAVHACRSLGLADVGRPVDAAEVARHCSSPAFRAGALWSNAATVNPARLALGLRARLIDAGIEVHERSPATSVEAGSKGVTVRTVAGSVAADRAVVAIGAAARGSSWPLRRRLSVASSHVVATEPVPEVIEEIGWRGGEAITDCRALLNYFRTTPDGRIVFGWGGGSGPLPSPVDTLSRSFA